MGRAGRWTSHCEPAALMRCTLAVRAHSSSSDMITDFDKVFALVNSGAMLPMAWSTIAAQAEERAVHHEQRSFARTASDLYLRAAVMYGRAQYSIFDGADERKARLRERCDHCVE